MNTSEFLMIAAATVPERTAMVCEGKTRTFAEMQERVNRLVNALQAMGVGQGQKVAVMALNSMEYVETYYATARLGGVFVPLNYRAKREEIVYMCNNSDAAVVFVGERYLDLLNAIRGELTTVKHFVAIDSKSGDMPYYEDLLAAHEPDEIFVEIDDDDPTIVIYTSGTTALPKGVVLTFLGLSVYVTNTVEPVDPHSSYADSPCLQQPGDEGVGEGPVVRKVASTYGDRRALRLSHPDRKEAPARFVGQHHNRLRPGVLVALRVAVFARVSNYIQNGHSRHHLSPSSWLSWIRFGRHVYQAFTKPASRPVEPHLHGAH